jgi:hypothetical protein
MSDARYSHSLDMSLTDGSDDAKWNDFWVNIEAYIRGLGFGHGLRPGPVHCQK